MKKQLPSFLNQAKIFVFGLTEESLKFRNVLLSVLSGYCYSYRDLRDRLRTSSIFPGSGNPLGHANPTRS